MIKFWGIKAIKKDRETWNKVKKFGRRMQGMVFEATGKSFLRTSQAFLFS